MAKKNKGVLGAMGNLIRWTIWGLAGVFAIAVYLNWTKPAQSPGADEIAVLPPADIAVSGVPDEEEAATVDTGAGETEPEPEPETGTIRIPGDAATYSLLNAFRRDDGSIEITTERVLGDVSETTIRLVRCAPLEVGVIAEGDGPRNDAPELVRIPLGDAAATLAAMACGAMK